MNKTDSERSIVAPLVSVKKKAEWLYRYEPLLMLVVMGLLFFPSRWSMLFFLPIPLMWLIRKVATGRWTIGTPIDGPLCFILLGTLVGYFISPDRDMSWTRLWYILAGVAVVYTLANWRFSFSASRWISYIIILGSVFIALFALVSVDWTNLRLIPLKIYQYFPNLYKNPTWGGYLPTRGMALNPRPIAMGLSTLLPIGLSWAITQCSQIGKNNIFRCTLGLLSIGFVLAIILLLQSIQAIIGLTLAGLVLVIWQYQLLHKRWFLGLLAIAMFAIMGGLWLVWNQGLSKLLFTIDNPVGIAVVLRLDIWQRAILLLRYMPFTGVGLDSYQLLQMGLYPGVLLGREPHAHSLFLQLALDLGVPGLIAFIWGIISLGKHVVRFDHTLEQNPDARTLLRGSAAGLVAYLGTGIIDNPWSLKSGMVLWVLVGVIVSITHGRMVVSNKPRQSSQPYIALTLLMLTFLSMLLFPALWKRNLGSIQAHWSLIGGNFATPQLNQAANNLENAASHGRATGDTYRLLARVYAAQQKPELAQSALLLAVGCDTRNSAAFYAPWEGMDSTDNQSSSQAADLGDLERIYRYWQGRYRTDAVWYAQLAILFEDYLNNPAYAAEIRNSGLAEGAEPTLLLLPVEISQ